MNSDSEVEFDSSDDGLSSNVQHSKRPFTRPFMHLKKCLQGAPCKSKYKALKAAGRVRDICFIKRYSNADIEVQFSKFGWFGSHQVSVDS